MHTAHATTTIEELHATIRRLRWNTELNMLNSAGLHEAIRQLPAGHYTVIFADIDRLKTINSATGSHCKTNRYLRAGLAVRDGEIAGQLYGDEIIFILNENSRAGETDAHAFVARITRQLASQPLTISERYMLAAALGVHVSHAKLSATFATQSNVAAHEILSTVEQLSSDVLLMKSRRDTR